MNAAFIRAKNSAHRMIKKNGVELRWSRPGRQETDEVTGLPTGGTPELIQMLWTVVLPPGNNPWDNKMDLYRGEDGTLELSKVRRVLISTVGMGFNLEDLDRVTINGETWIFTQASELSPDTETLILKKGIIRRL